MRLLVTGGAGFVGSHTCTLLLKLGFKIILYDSFTNSSRNVIPRIISVSDSSDEQLIVVHGDIRNRDKLDSLFKRFINQRDPINAVIHFAGLKSVSESVLNPLLYWDVNVCGSKILFDVMQSNNCFSLIFSSSATIYGDPNSIPIPEDHPRKPINPYGRTKLVIEYLLSDIYCSQPNKWRICSLRYFNPVGAHPSGLLGEDPRGKPSNLFPLITQVAIGRRTCLDVYGKDWDTFDGYGVRDYIHVMDIADGHIAALEYLIKNKTFNISINLGSGSGYSVLEIINQFEIAIGKKIPYKVVSRRSGDLPILVADVNKSKKLLGWSCKKNLTEMCNHAWNWQCENPTGYL